MQFSLKDRWIRLCQNYSDDKALMLELWDEIVTAYTSYKRHYHNLHHITSMILLLDEYSDLMDDPSLMEFSIFYHDIVYNSRKKDNEERSADLASKRLSQLGLSPEKVQKVRQQILATKTHQATEEKDTNYLLDIDISILGDEWENYLVYAKNVRKEYSIYPYVIYKKGRREVLESFLQMDRLFHTDNFQELYEEQARKNIQEEIKIL